MTMHRPRPFLVRAAAVAAVAAAIAAAASTTAGGAGQAEAYAEGRHLAKTIVERGVPYAGRRAKITKAYCAGLPQYGVRSKSFFNKEFRRFNCSLTGADRHTYRAEIAITGNTPTRLSWRVVSIRRLS